MDRQIARQTNATRMSNKVNPKGLLDIEEHWKLIQHVLKMQLHKRHQVFRMQQFLHSMATWLVNVAWVPPFAILNEKKGKYLFRVHRLVTRHAAVAMKTHQSNARIVQNTITNSPCNPRPNTLNLKVL